MSGLPSAFDRAKLENLAERIYQGQVVFFVGAGYSLDSEALTAYRLMLRLLVRFEAFAAERAQNVKHGQGDHHQARALQYGGRQCSQRADRAIHTLCAKAGAYRQQQTIIF